MVKEEEYMQFLRARIVAHAFNDLMLNLQNLRQVGSIKAYLDTFDE